MGHPAALYYHLRGASIVAPWIAYLTAADLALSLLLPFKPFAPTFVFNLSSRIASSVWRWIQVIFERFNGANITFSGDKLPREESAIVVCNHVTWADFYMIQALAVKAGMLGRCRWFAKIQLRMVPFLGWGLWAMGMPMVTRNWMRDQGELNRVFRGIVSKQWPVCKSPTGESVTEGVAYRVVQEADATIPRADKFQRGHSLHSREVRGNGRLVREERPPAAAALAVSPHQGLRHDGAASEADTARQGRV